MSTTTQNYNLTKPDGSERFSLQTMNGNLDAIDAAIAGAAETYELPKASASTLGGVKVGDNLSIASDGTLSAETGSAYELPKASTSTLGGVKVGSYLSISNDGTLSATPAQYDLPTATYTRKGGVKVGEGLTMDNDAKLGVRVDGSSIAINDAQEIYATGAVSASQLPLATSDSVGAVKPDNITITVDQYGTLSVDTEQVGGGSGGIDSGSVNSPLYVDSGVLGLDTSQLAQSLAGTGLTSDPSTGVMSLDEHSLYSTLESNSNGTLESGSGIQVKLDSSGGLTNTGNGIGIDLSSLLMMSGFLSYSGGLTNDGNGLAIQLGSSNCLVNNGSGLDIDLQALAQALQPYLS